MLGLWMILRWSSGLYLGTMTDVSYLGLSSMLLKALQSFSRFFNKPCNLFSACWYDGLRILTAQWYTCWATLWATSLNANHRMRTTRRYFVKLYSITSCASQHEEVEHGEQWVVICDMGLWKVFNEEPPIECESTVVDLKEERGNRLGSVQFDSWLR